MTPAPIARLTDRRLLWQALAVLVGALAMAGASRVAFDIGPAPITLQTFAVFTLAGLMGGRLTLVSLLVWLAAAGLGAPVLAEGAGGMGALTGASQGFLMGFLAAGPWTGFEAEKNSSFVTLLVVFLLGHVLVLAMGWVALSNGLGWSRAWSGGVLPFLPGAVLKSLGAAVVVRAAAR